MTLMDTQYRAAVRRYDRLMTATGIKEYAIMVDDSDENITSCITRLVNKVREYYDAYLDENTKYGKRRHSDNKRWRSEKDKLKRFIDAYEPYCEP